MKIESLTTKLDFDDVLIKPKRSTLESRRGVNLSRDIKFPHSSYVYSGIPIMSANMDSVTTIESAKVLAEYGMFSCFTKFLDLDSLENCGIDKNHYAVSLGNDMEQLKVLKEKEELFQYVCIDVANGYSESFSKFVSEVRKTFPSKVIIAGNVCTPEMTEELILRGSDIVKVGIGGGSGCLTRKKTGVGYPQLSAIIECSDAAHGLNGRIIGDGGCRVPSDIVKGFGAGADFMMLGSMLAAHTENSEFDDNGFTLHYGMSSSVAMMKHYGGVSAQRTSEGRVTRLKSRGPLASTLSDIQGSLRSACTYVGAKDLKSLSKCTTFILVNNQFSKEYEKDTIGE